MTDPRHVALILDAGYKKANEWAGPADAALVQALEAMTEMAAWYAEHPDGGALFPVEEEFAKLASQFR